MIKKIKISDYQKRFDNMNPVERQMLKERVGQWLCSSSEMLLRRANAADAQLQNVMQVSGRWNDHECAAWDEGILLLTSFANVADTWLPDKLYIKAANRSIRRLVKCLKSMGGPDGEKLVTAQENEVVTTRKEVEESPTSDNPSGKSAGMADEEHAGPTAGGRHKATGSHEQQSQSGAVPRPKHIDQYVHLLPEKTQERAAKYGQLMHDMEEARENMRLLMNDSNANDNDREKWAKTATRIDAQLKGIRKELDTEWAKVVKAGRVIVDDLGIARVVNPDGEPAAKVTGLTEEEKAKVKSLRSWLRDVRSGNGKKRAAYVERWKEKYRELVSIGGKDVVTEAVCEAARHYGINIDKLQYDFSPKEEPKA